MASDLKKSGQKTAESTAYAYCTSLNISVTASLIYSLRGEIEFENYPKGLLPYQTLGK
jgi:hypothetical protein